MNTAPTQQLVEPEAAPLAPAIGDYLTVVTRRSGTVILPFVVLTLLATIGAFMLPQEFSESTIVQVEDPDVVGAFYAQIGLQVPHKQILSTINQKIGSVAFLKDIVDKVDVNEGYDRFDPKEAAVLMAEVRNRLSIGTTFQNKGPDLFSITYRGRDAAKVANFVNEVRKKYEDDFLAQYTNAVVDAFAHVKAIYDAAKKEYDDSTAALKNFQDSNGAMFVGDPNDLASQMRERLGKYESDLITAEAQLKGQENTRDDVTSKLAATSPERPGTRTDKVSDRYEKQAAIVEQLRRDLEEAKKVRTEIDPTYRSIKAAHDTAVNRLAQIPQLDVSTKESEPNPEYDRLVAQQKAAQSEIARLEAVITRTKQAIVDLTAELNSLPEKLKRAEEVKARRDNARFQYDRAHRQYQTAEATRSRIIGKETSFFTVIDRPTAESARDKAPVSPNIPLFIGIGAFVGLIFGAGLAFIREFATPAFTTANQVRHGLAVPVLGEVAVLRTAAEDAAIKRKRLLTGFAAIFVAALLAFVHVAYFTKGYRDVLPRPVFDAMRRIYGKG